MSLSIASLNSGSNGNCYYVGNEREAVLIDAGISCRETEKRMARLGLQLQHVKAIFISHEHTDHIRGVEVLSKKYGIPVYISEKTLGNSRLALQTDVYHFVADEVITIGGLAVTAFGKLHDARDPHSFTVEGNGISIAVLTDIGDACEQVKHHFSRCNAAFLEANYDEDLLENGPYPWHLKNRIRGGKGHLSNRQALELFLEHRSELLTHVLLCHLSKENNRPELAQELFEEHADKTFVTVASRYEESAVYRVMHGVFPEKLPYVRKTTVSQATRFVEQLSLFD
jgi:phosphoribosyl 1,2-cyclic phosphodiesterase